MYGLPQQTLAEALADVETALSYRPRHLSCYQLTLEPNTPFAAAPGAAYKATCARTCRRRSRPDSRTPASNTTGPPHSAQPGFRCQHNLNYWSFGDYLGIGAGAHGKLTMHDRVLRQMRFGQPAQCQKQVASGQPVHEETNVDATDLPFEFMSERAAPDRRF